MASSSSPSADEKEQVNIGNGATTLDHELLIGTAVGELEYKVEFHNKLIYTCLSKCIDPRYKEGDLNIGENSCVDRCVAKYWQVNNIIGQVIASRRPTW